MQLERQCVSALCCTKQTKSNIFSENEHNKIFGERLEQVLHTKEQIRGVCLLLGSGNRMFVRFLVEQSWSWKGRTDADCTDQDLIGVLETCTTSATQTVMCLVQWYYTVSTVHDHAEIWMSNQTLIFQFHGRKKRKQHRPAVMRRNGQVAGWRATMMTSPTCLYLVPLVGVIW